MLTTALKFSKCFQIQSFRNCRSAAIQSEKTAAKTDEAVKTTLVQKWMKYWKTVLNDYRDVATDVGKDIKEKPIKSAIIFSLVGVFTYIVRHNPDEKSFRDAFIKCANEVLLVHQSLQKQETVEHLKHIEQCYNTKQVRRLNLGVATIIWFDYNSKTCNTYLANCSYLKLKYSDFYTRILDIGFMDHWFILNEKMMDYDVNY